MIHTVVPGDTLYHIAQEYLNDGNNWSIIWKDNRDIVDNPDLIYPGQEIYIPKHASSSVIVDVSNNSYQPSHGSNNSADDNTTSLSGTLGCSGLESLWIDNGGYPSKAFTAAEIAMAESSGQEFATGLAGEKGYWQINPNHGSLSTYDPNGNAHAAIQLSDNGTDWQPWTTYTSGDYIGKC